MNHTDDVPNAVRATVYRDGVRAHYPAFGRRPGGRRDGVQRFTDRARSRLAFSVQNAEVAFTHMVTLTYPEYYPPDGRRVKAHLNRILSWMRARSAAAGQVFGYLWWLEFQRRGAPHYHLLLTYPAWTPQELSGAWYDAVGSGDEKHLAAGTRQERLRTSDGAARYATAYASKETQKDVPTGYENVGRFWGMSRNARPRPRAAYVIGGGRTLQERLATWPYAAYLDNAPLTRLYGAAAHMDTDGLTAVDPDTGELLDD